MTMTRRRLLDDTFKKTVVGNPAIATDSLARMYPGIEMQGWTDQDGTPTPEAPVPIISAGSWNEETQKYEYQVKLFKNFGLKRNIPTESDNWSRFTFNERWNEIDKIICKMSGVNQVGQNIIFCGENSTGVAEIPYINLGGLNNPQFSGLTDFIANKAGYEISDGGYYELEYTFSSDSNNLICNTWNTQWSKEIIYYEIAFYKNNILTEKYVPVVSDPNKMYGEVSKTYIRNDKNMGYELVEPISDYQFLQTVTLTADRPLTKWDKLEKRNSQWGWVYKSEEIESYTDESVPVEYFSTTGQLSVGAQVWYETTTETFVPLATAEQEAMNALYTYRPTTVLSNQQGCQMALTYKTRKGVGGGNLLDYRKLVNPAYWIGTTPENAYKYFDIVLKNNTKYKLSCTKNNMNKDYVDEHPIDFETTFYMGENPGTFNGNYCFGHIGYPDTKQTEYQFTTTGNPYYLNLCIYPENKFTPENLHIVFDELLPGLKLQEVN